MPSDLKAHIDRISILRDKLQDLANKIRNEAGFKNTTEVIELIEMWGKVNDKINDLISVNFAIDIRQEDFDELTQNQKDVLERDLVKAKNIVKSLLRLEKQATALYESLKDFKPEKEEEEQEEKKQEQKKESTPKRTRVIEKPKVAAKPEKVAANVEEKAKKINTKKTEAVSSINSRIDDMGSVASSILMKSIEEMFDFKGGKIVADKNFVKQLNRLTIDVLDLLQKDPKFSGPVSQFVKRMTPISDAITDFQKSVNDIKVPAFETAKKIVIDEIIDKMLNNGLNQNFVQPLRDLIYQNVSGDGLSLSQARIQVKELAATTGKLGQYVEETAQQAVDSYSGAINTKLLETFDYDGLIMTGTLIDNSSSQCRFVIEELKGRITRENWPQVVAKVTKRAPLIEGTTFDNLPSHRLHWGCRHSFYPIIVKKSS